MRSFAAIGLFEMGASDSLELREPAGAFGRIEEWLRERGFFEPGGEGLVADLFLGYGLSDAIRRENVPAPPEPCAALPLAACRVGGEATLATDRYKGLALGDWEPSWTADEHGDAVEAVREAIRRGDVYQVNVVQHLSAPFAGDASRARRRACAAAPARAAAVRDRSLGGRVRLARAVSSATG